MQLLPFGYDPPCAPAVRATTYFLVLGSLLAASSQPLAAEEAGAQVAYAQLAERLDAQAAEIHWLKSQLGLHDVPRSNTPRTPVVCDESCPAAGEPDHLPVVAGACRLSHCGDAAAADYHAIRYAVDYDDGLTFRAFCPTQHPFELNLNAWMQMRHHAFDRDVRTWTDNAGVTRPVESRNAFDIERARLVLAGQAWDPRLKYFIQLDGDTDGRHAVDFFDHWWGWQWTDDLLIQLGKRKVPASRQWLLGARSTRLVDRPMATDFFRPDRTVGVFLTGKAPLLGHWEAMVGNGYQTANLPNDESDNNLTLAATNYYQPLGDFGSNPVDFDGSEELVVRIGQSAVYSPQSHDSAGTSLPEVGFLRLSDGTILTQTGALTPGVTVSDFDLYFYSVDLAAKYRLWSIDAEFYLRWIEQLAGDGPLTVTDLLQRGFYIEGGRFLVPRRLDVNVRYSQVSGLLGTATEIAAGINWYPLATQRLKVSMDVTSLDGSPLNNTTTDILAGDDGVLFRTQVQAEF